MIRRFMSASLIHMLAPTNPEMRGASEMIKARGPEKERMQRARQVEQQLENHQRKRASRDERRLDNYKKLIKLSNQKSKIETIIEPKGLTGMKNQTQEQTQVGLAGMKNQTQAQTQVIDRMAILNAMSTTTGSQGGYAVPALVAQSSQDKEKVSFLAWLLCHVLVGF